MSSNTTSTFTILHFESNGFFSLFIKDYKPNQDLELSFNFFTVGIPMHVKFICKWSFWDVFWTPLELFSPRRFHEWLPTIISILFSYHTRSHSTLNYPCPWGGSSLNHDQTFMWNLSHCHGGNVVSNHNPCFMPSISQCFCNTFLPTLVWNNNQGWMWNNNPWHQMHLKLSPY
jgi:hypothetical protein